MRTLKVLGFLLAYPEEQHRMVTGECRAILQQEAWLPESALRAVEGLLKEMETTPLLDLQEEYVSLFDRTPSLSLHLFEHVHGDSRDRGQALVDLTEVYQDAGMQVPEGETPDYLPMFLEYVSTLAPDAVQEHLGSTVTILAALRERLKNRGSAYAAVFGALVEAAGRMPDTAALMQEMKQASGAAYDLEALDEEWKEQFAFENTAQTTGQSSGCPKAEEMLARMGQAAVKKG